MLDLYDVEALLKRATYKPNVRFDASYRPGSAPYGEVMVRAVMWTLDSRQTYPEPDRWIGLAINGIKVSPDIVFPQMDGGRVYVDLSPIKVTVGAIVPWPVLNRGEPLFWDWLKHSIIHELEHHEEREWFKVDGEVYDDPHKEFSFNTRESNLTVETKEMK